MKKRLLTAIVLCSLMLATSVAATAFRPSLNAAASNPDLASRMPQEFGDWQQLESSSLVVNPQQTEALDRIYSDVLSRTYRSKATGQVVMLSIAYGATQNKDSQVHRPEVCYPAQGFQIKQNSLGAIETPYRSIPVRHLITRLDNRNEPLIYWIRIGDRLARGWLDQKLAVVSEGLAGRIADGLIFRVSSISDNPEKAFAAQKQFVIDFLAAVPPDQRAFFIGTEGSPGS